MKKILGVLVIIGGSLSAVMAQDAPPPPPPGGGFPQGGGQRMQMMQMPTFADLDKNKDKKLSKDEFAAALPPQAAQFAAQAFEMTDENKDGFIDETEFTNSQRRMMGGGGGMQVRLGEVLVRSLDKNADHKVSAQEFSGIKEVFTKLDRD